VNANKGFCRQIYLALQVHKTSLNMDLRERGCEDGRQMNILDRITELLKG
jgi:hypothetical protein